jgi:hypothetical protein
MAFYCTFCPAFTSVLVTAVLVLQLLGLAAAQSSGNTERQTLFLDPQFSKQIACVRDCFASKDTTGGCWYDNIGKALGCTNNPGCDVPAGGTTWAALNSCYCRSDLQSQAQAAITSCVRSNCTVGDLDVNAASAGALQRSYCSRAGFPQSVDAEPTTTVASPATTTVSVYVTTTVTVSSNAASIALAAWAFLGFRLFVLAAIPRLLMDDMMVS